MACLPWGYEASSRVSILFVVEGLLTPVVTAFYGSWIFLFLPLVGLTINLESQPSGISFRWCAAFLPAASGTETRRRLSVWQLCSASVLSSHSVPTPPPQNVFHYLLFCNQSSTTSQECKMLLWVLVADVRYSLRSDDEWGKATWHGLFLPHKDAVTDSEKRLAKYLNHFLHLTLLK